MTDPRRRRVCAALLSAIVALSGPVLAAPVVVEYTGTVAPGTSGGTFDNALPYPAVAGGNAIGFVGVTTQADYGVWREQNGTLSKVVVDGDPVAGLPGATYESPDSLAMNSSGQVAFYTDILNASPSLFAVASDSGGSLNLVVRSGTTPPGTDGQFYTFTHPVIASNGSVAFQGQITGGSSNFGVWSTGFGSGLSLVERDGMAAPGGGTFSSVYSLAPVSIANGIVAFQADLNSNSNTLDSVWKYTAGGLQAVAVQNNAVPGLAGTTYSSFRPPVVNDSGNVAYRAQLSGGSVYNGIFRDLGTGPALIVGNGSAAPSPAGAKFTGINDPTMNASGEVAFTGYLDAFSVPVGTGTEGLWTVSPAGTISEVARENGTVPDRAGTTFGNGYQNFALSNTGQVAWYGNVNVAGGTRYGLFAQNAQGQVVTVVEVGDTVQVAPGQTRTVESIAFADSVNGYYGQSVLSSWNTSDELVYTLTFTDSTSGIFETSFAAAAGHAWQNPANALDVNDDGNVFPSDVIVIINALNQQGSHALTIPPPAGAGPPPYLDTNGDDALSPLDALLIINYLNAQSLAAQSFGAVVTGQAVPEPSTLALGLLAAGLLVLVRRGSAPR